jgi:hypothetical protein
MRIVAIENALEGEEIDDDYAASDVVRFRYLRPGDVAYMLLKDGENVAIGDKLESAGDGDLQKHTADSAGAVEYPEAIVGEARDALDLSDSSGADPSSRRIRVRIV